MKIKVRHVRKFGFNRFYPDDGFTQKLREIFKEKERDREVTYTEKQLKGLKEIGFDIIINPEYSL